MPEALFSPSSPPTLFRPWLWLAALAVLLLWFGPLDTRHLLRADEGRYAEIAREMVVSGDWVTIRYQDLKYFEKPPFHLWMTALAFEAFGTGDWQARLWVALSGLVGIAATAWTAQRWLGAGALAAAVLIACPTWVLGAHFNSLDMSVAGALALALAALLNAQHPGCGAAEARRLTLLAWVAMAVAVLTKGLIGLVIPGLVLLLYTALSRDWRLWTRLEIARGLPLFLLITVPWFWLVQQRNPEHAEFFFIHEHFQRYTSTVHRRSAPAWYFVPQLLAGFAPWLGLLPAMVRALQAEHRGDEGLRGRAGFRPLLFCAAWVLAIFAFFSASGSKLPGYILPLYPGLALLAVAGLRRLSAAAWARQLLGGAVVSVMLVVGAAMLVAQRGRFAPDVQAYTPWLLAAALLAVLAYTAARALLRRGQAAGSVAALAVGVLGAVTVGLQGHEAIGRPASGVDLVPAIRASLRPGMPIYGVRYLDHTLPFYLGCTLVMVEDPDELDFGTRQQPDRWFPTLEGFRPVWTEGPPALAVMRPEQFEALQRQGWPLPVVARDARRVVVRNPATGP